MINKINVVSFSGGRTSAYLVYLMQNYSAYGIPVHYVFMDTGFEHPKTYEFIRNVVKNFRINLVCLRVKINPVLGQGNDYEQIDINDMCCDLKPWEALLKKYGTPYRGGAFCTMMLKQNVFVKYCNDNFGKGNYYTWLGIRIDEPRRLKEKDGFKYLAEISPFKKPDVLAWWETKSFNLQLPEYSGNCLFCIKKGINKVALAAKSNPEMAAKFIEMIKSNNVRVVEGRKAPNPIMYRQDMSLEGIMEMYEDVTIEQLEESLRLQGPNTDNPCEDSCEVF
jgi:hypothetical protein